MGLWQEAQGSTNTSTIVGLFCSLPGLVPDEGHAEPEAEWAELLLAAGLAVSRLLSYALTGGYEDNDAKTGNAAL